MNYRWQTDWYISNNIIMERKTHAERSIWKEHFVAADISWIKTWFYPLFYFSDLDEAEYMSRWSSQEVNVPPVFLSQVIFSHYFVYKSVQPEM